METVRDNRGRFQRGTAPGPGRAKFSIVSILRDKLQEIPDGDTRPRIERLIEEYIADAEARKDGAAIRDMIDRFDGRPKQHLDIQDDRQEAWHQLLRDVFLDPDSATADDPSALREGEAEAPDPGGSGQER